MTQPDPSNRSTYRIATEPVAGAVRGYRGARKIVDSDAVKVMHETRLRPSLYFPRGALVGATLESSDMQTFCPFKGTARYWHLVVDGERLENAVWSYERALPEARAVEGMIGFMPGVIDRFEADGALPGRTDDGHVSGALVDWLMRRAAFCSDPIALTRQLGERMNRDGIPVKRLNVLVWSLHPEIAGRGYLWRRETDAIDTRELSYDALDSDMFQNSPIRHVADGRGGVRQPLDVEDMEFFFPIMTELKAEGATDYVAMPLPFSDGRINVMTLATDEPGGFSTADLGMIFECLNVIGRYYEAFALRSNEQALLQTYLGRRAGAKVLAGSIRRGDGENIDAAILFCDLRGSTRLAASMSRDSYLALLNAFFESVVAPVHAHNGEILKFIGDGVLAIFPVEEDAAAAAATAVEAAVEIAESVRALIPPELGEPLGCSIGLHIGDVTFGNIGSLHRLDFTVVGMAANIAARLSDLGKSLDECVLMSGDVARAARDRVRPLGKHPIRDVERPVAVFAADIAEAPAVRQDMIA